VRPIFNNFGNVSDDHEHRKGNEENRLDKCRCLNSAN
jgi:hypothetical protein